MGSNEPVRNECEVRYERFHIPLLQLENANIIGVV